MGKCLDTGFRFVCLHCAILYDSPLVPDMSVALVEVAGVLHRQPGVRIGLEIELGSGGVARDTHTS